MFNFTFTTGKTPLQNLCVLEVTGSERLSFLHGQFTNHVQRLNNQFMSAAWCNPQGRMLANMRLLADADRVLIILSADIAEHFCKRLRMFILRSDVSVRLAEELSVFGLINANIPNLDEECVQKTNDIIFARSTDCQGARRYMAVASKQALQAIDLPDIALSQWQVGELLCGLAWIDRALQDKLIPQMINMDRLNGLVFDKGCYPGQEVISRMQHIGKCPRRTALFYLPSSDICEGADVCINGTPDALIVNCVTLTDVTLALVCLPIKALESHATVTVDGVALSLLKTF